MKALVLSAAMAAAASAIIPLSSAAAAVMTVGGPLSTICYQSARSGDGRSSAVDGCTRALQEEALSASDRAATSGFVGNADLLPLDLLAATGRDLRLGPVQPALDVASVRSRDRHRLGPARGAP